MSLICEVKCFRNGNVLCYQKSVQDFSKFGVGFFLNDLNSNLGKLRISVTKDKDMNEFEGAQFFRI